MASLLAFVLVAGTAGAALASWMVPPTGYRLKDFCLVKRDGLYHIFYTNENRRVPHTPVSEISLGHATSWDLYIWTHQETVLTVRPGEWDNAHVWAPHIVQKDGVYWMFYTGVSDDQQYAYHQRIGVATSTDLFQWNRLDEPVFSCAQVPWSYCDTTTVLGGNFRDPFVMPNPQAPGEWLMYYSAHPSMDPTNMMVGLAQSTGDLAEWSNLKPMGVTYRTVTGQTVAESPHVYRHGNTWFLFWTTTAAGGGMRYATSADPAGDLDAWTYQGPVATMLGQSTNGWFASETLVDGLREYFAFVNTDRADMREMVWNQGNGFTLVSPSLFHIKKIRWSVAEAESGRVVNLVFDATGWYNQVVKLEALEVDPGGAEVKVPIDSLGLPKEILLTGPTTTIPWTTRMFPDNDSLPGPELVIRSVDRTAVSGPLHILPTQLPPPPPLPYGDPRRSGEDGHPPGDSYDWHFALRPLDGTPVAKGPALLVEMPEAGRARVDLFDIQGRRVRNLADRDFGKGGTVLPWDGRTQAGVAARPGVYVARLATPAGVRWARLLLRP